PLAFSPVSLTSRNILSSSVSDFCVSTGSSQLRAKGFRVAASCLEVAVVKRTNVSGPTTWWIFMTIPLARRRIFVGGGYRYSERGRDRPAKQPGELWISASEKTGRFRNSGPGLSAGRPRVGRRSGLLARVI